MLMTYNSSDTKIFKFGMRFHVEYSIVTIASPTQKIYINNHKTLIKIYEFQFLDVV